MMILPPAIRQSTVYFIESEYAFVNAWNDGGAECPYCRRLMMLFIVRRDAYSCLACARE